MNDPEEYENIILDELEPEAFRIKRLSRKEGKDIKLELSHNSNNHCINHVAVQNLSDKKITYFVRIWRGDIWYFKHQIELEPGQSKSWRDASQTYK